MRKLTLPMVLIIAGLLMSSCRLVDFTIISSKNVSLDVKKDAPRVKAGGATVKDAVDKAIEKAGSGYDALIDGVIYQRLFFGFRVVGTPIKTSETKK